MKRSLNDKEEKCGGDEKQPRIATVNDKTPRHRNYTSPASKENVSTFNVSERLVLENISVKIELKTVKENYIKMESENKTLKNENTKIKEVAEKFMVKSEKEKFEEKKRADEAVAETEKLKQQLSHASSFIKRKEERIGQLQNQISSQCEINGKSLNTEVNDKIKFLENQIFVTKKAVMDEKKKKEEAISREENLKNRVSYYRSVVISKENIVSDLQRSRENQNKRIKTMEKQRLEIETENEQLGDRLKLLFDSDVINKVEIAKLQKQLEEVTEELGNKKIQIDQEIEKMLTTTQSLLKSKDKTIIELQAQIKMHQRLNTEKIQEIQNAKEISKIFEDQVLKLENKCDLLRQQIESGNEKANSALKKMEVENEVLKKNLDEAKEENAKMKKSVKESAKEMFKEWKKEEKEKRKKEDQNCECLEKDQLIFELKKQLNEEKELNESFLNASNTSFITGPKWIVPLELCRNIYDSNSSFTSFISHYTNRLFTTTEILMPEESCKEKYIELKAVVSYFYKPENEEIKEMYYGKIKTLMNTKRSNARSKEYKNCNSTRSIGITSDGIKFYYSLKIKHNIKKWKPFGDKEFTDGLEFKITPSSAPFGIPFNFSTSDYILVIQNSSEDGQKLYKIIPKTGFIELIAKKVKTEKQFFHFS